MAVVNSLISRWISLQLLIIICLLSWGPSDASALYNVASYGAKSDGKTDSTKAFAKAWAVACSARVAPTIYVPKGSFVVKALVFQGPCKHRVTFQIKGTLLAPSNYWNLGQSGHWITFSYVNGVTINGGGTLDARAASFWACKNAAKNCPNAAQSLSIQRSSNVVVSGLTSLNSQMFHIFVAHCWNVNIRGVNIKAPSWSPNTDGIHVQDSTGVTISSSSIKTGDDCISLGPGSNNIWVERINCGPGHGISIGSLGQANNEAMVRNVTVSTVVFTGTQNGVRVKTWARAYAGSVSRILFQNIIMNNVFNPIIIDQKYCPSGKNCPSQSSGVKINGVTYKNIKGTSASQIATKFVCSKTKPCSNIKMQNINLSHYSKKLTTTSYCESAAVSNSGVTVPRSCASRKQSLF